MNVTLNRLVNDVDDAAAVSLAIEGVVGFIIIGGVDASDTERSTGRAPAIALLTPLLEADRCELGAASASPSP
jgi:hypothetical protein